MLLHTSNTFTGYNYPLDEADVVFLGVPFSSVSPQSIYGPLMVRESLKLIEDYSKAKGSLFDKLKVCDVGDLEIVPGSFGLTSKRLKETINDILEANKKALQIFVGGDHSITLPVVETLKPKTLIQLDAHADLRKEFLGNPFMHQTWAYHASKMTKIVQIGVRSLNIEEDEFIAKSKNIRMFTLKEFLETKHRLEKPVHLTIDMDVFDPAYVVTGLPEPEGLKPKDVFDVLEKIPKLRSVDITEIGDNSLPSKTGFLAGHLIKRVLEKLV